MNTDAENQESRVRGPGFLTESTLFERTALVETLVLRRHRRTIA